MNEEEVKKMVAAEKKLNDENAQILSSIESAQYYYAHKVCPIGYSNYLTCVNAFKAHMLFMNIHSTDGEVEKFRMARAEFTKFQTKLDALLEQMEEDAKEISKENIKGTIN